MGTNNVSAKENGDGIYVVYDRKLNGNFLLHYSKTDVPDALAFIKPCIIIPAFKYRTPAKIADNVELGHTRYYEAWTLCFKEAKNVGGKFSFLPKFAEKMKEESHIFPPMQIYTLSGSKTEKVPLTITNLSLENIKVLACVSGSFFELDDVIQRSKELSIREFVEKILLSQYSAYITLPD